MGYIPQDAEWYVAELVMEISVCGGRCNVIHRNLTLITAHSPEEAYSKAIRMGKEGETQYMNPKDQRVDIRFRGISTLDVVYDPFVDGAEISFVEELAVPETRIQSMLPPKGKLAVFTAPHPGEERDPDYRSKAVVERAVKRIARRSPPSGFLRGS
jgi:hypothetical protein